MERLEQKVIIPKRDLAGNQRMLEVWVQTRVTHLRRCLTEEQYRDLEIIDAFIEAHRNRTSELQKISNNE